jgi:hypothetical protein
MNPTGASVLWPWRHNMPIHSSERWRPCSFVIEILFIPSVQHRHSVRLDRLCFLKFLKYGHSSYDWYRCHDWSLIISVPSFIGSSPRCCSQPNIVVTQSSISTSLWCLIYLAVFTSLNMHAIVPSKAATPMLHTVWIRINVILWNSII